jgi:chromosome segregation ATPase
MFSLTKRKEERALKAKIQTKIGHLSNQLQAANAVLAEKDAIIAQIKADTIRANAATAEINKNISAMKASLSAVKKELATANARTDAKAIELAATAGHQPKHINQ